MTLSEPHTRATDVPFSRLAVELTTAMRKWEDDGDWWSDESFTDLALRAFQLQFDGVPAYRRYCERRGINPAGVSLWTEVPPAPVAAFRSVPLVVGGESAARLEFLTSGTTAGPADRGRHLVRDPAIYRASMEAGFWRLALDNGQYLFGSLVPPFSGSRGSSLAWMIDGLMHRFGARGSRSFASATGVDWSAAADFVAAAESARHPVCILTTTLALDAWLRHLEDEDRHCQLPAGSIIMDTGGAKGREGLSRAGVRNRAAERLGIDPSRVVNEFGMTELLSQLYSLPETPDQELGDSPDLASETPWLQGPPWLRVRVLDPNDLSPLPDGESGLLCYFDLANLGSVSAVLTEDVGRVSGRAVQWLRRFPGAPPRGCSLATAELLAARESLVSG